jgi:hypothetical protein
MRRFLITGCQRSGTTLLRLILGSHSKIHCYDEYLAYARLRDGDASEAQGCQLVGYKIPRWTEQLNDRKIGMQRGRFIGDSRRKPTLSI